MRDEKDRQKRLARKRRKREGALEARRQDTSVRLSSNAASWPIVRAYVPVPHIWASTGLGSVGIVRQQPDGRYASAFFILELLGGGLQSLWGQIDVTLDEIDATLVEMRERMPPMTEGAPELAAAFAWGGRALAESEGFVGDQPQLDELFALVPVPPGTPRKWARRLTALDGLSPAGLVEVIRANRPPADLPEGKETMILTEATFAVVDAEAAVAALREAEPEFDLNAIDGTEATFSWTREYPRNHDSPLRLLGGRQVLGSVQVTPGKLVAEAKTLSMTARLLDRLGQLLGEGLRHESTRWTGARELLSGRTGSDAGD